MKHQNNSHPRHDVLLDNNVKEKHAVCEKRLSLICVVVIVCCIAAAAVPRTFANVVDCKPFAFRLPQSFEIGANSFKSTYADFDGDGNKDLAAANNTQFNSISVAFGDGYGGFGPPKPFPAQISPYAIVAGDFNNDGKPDLMAGSRNSLAILLNDGSGSFLAPSVISFVQGLNYEDLKVGDFTGDGIVDIAALMSDGNLDRQLHIYYGYGQGTFVFGANFDLDGRDGIIEVGNLNGDAYSDIIVSRGDSFSQRNIGYMFGRPGGGYTITPGFNVPEKAVRFAIADLNNDNLNDFLVGFEDDTTPTQSYLRPWIGTGSGAFTPGQQINTRTPTDVILADFDGDGFKDLASSINGVSLLVQYGSGNGSFQDPQYWALPTNSRSILADDADKDGKTDILAIQTAFTSRNEISVLKNLGGRKFYAPRSILNGLSEIAAADLNGDGNLDFVSTYKSSFASSSDLFINLNGPDSFGADATIETPAALAAMTVGDFNGDGKKDVVTAHENNARRLAVFLGDGAGHLGAPMITTINVGFRNVIAGKFNGDAFEDVFVVDDAGRGYVMLADGDGTFTTAPNFPISLQSSFVNLQKGDFNEDGNLDLIVSNGQVRLLLGDGTGQFAQSSNAIQNLSDVVVGDFNGDEHLDLAGFGPGWTLIALLGNGNAQFPDQFGSPTQANGDRRSLISGDFNLDGRDDVAFVILLNDLKNLIVVPTGSPTAWGAPIKYSLGGFNGYASSLLSADYDNDGRIDIGYNDEFSRGVIYNTAASEPCISISDVSAAEGDSGTANAVFSVTLSTAATETVRVNYTLTGGTAVLGQDLREVSGRLEIAAGQTSAVINVPIIGDLVDEIDETFTISLASAANAFISRSSATGTILDNDVEPTISISDLSRTESSFSGIAFNFAVTLSAPSAKPVSFVYSTSDGTAVSGSDYNPTSLGFTIQPGVTSSSVSVLVVSDSMYERDEDFFVNLSQPVNVRIGDGQARAVILDDDQIPRLSIFGNSAAEGDSGMTNAIVTVNLSNPTYLPVTFHLITSNGSARSGLDYVAADRQFTIQPGQTAFAAQIQVIGDAVREPSEVFFVNAYNASNAEVGGPSQTQFFILDDDPTLFDYDGDGRADLSVFRPSNNSWYITRPTSGFTSRQFGASGDLLAPADYDGDKKADVAVFRPSNGTWYMLMSQSQTYRVFAWGADGDITVPSDRDGDGKADLVVFRPSNSTWYTRMSATGEFSSTAFGEMGDRPVAGDFDGDGKGDIGLYRPSNNSWYIINSSQGFTIQTWGEAGDIPVPADYDADGKTDAAVFRPSTGEWFRSMTAAGFDSPVWGEVGDKPVPADFDGDGKADIAVYRPSNSTWYIVGSSTGIRIQPFGENGDTPIPGSFIY